jgi:hypothetical protein
VNALARPVTDAGLLTSLSTVDAVLADHVSELGHDFIGYRNHVYRVANLCVAIVGDRVELEKIAVAAVFHDLGIWTDKTFDYIEPSIALAHDYLAGGAQMRWIPEIERMILDHHKITPATPGGLVESFRRADWVDVIRGVRRFGVPRRFIKSVYERWPSAGFHWRLVQLTVDRFRAHPLAPLPMVRW